jgi:hypothetical protein
VLFIACYIPPGTFAHLARDVIHEVRDAKTRRLFGQDLAVSGRQGLGQIALPGTEIALPGR